MPANAQQVCVIGAGISGLALAIRLQASGLATTLCEARAAPGGIVSGTKLAGYNFDLVPNMIDDMAGLEALWQLGGENAGQATFLPITPQHRFTWPDGGHFTLSGDPAATRAEVARFAPGDLAGFEELIALAQTDEHLNGDLSSGWKGLLHHLPRLMRRHNWRSVDGLARAHIESERLAQALSVLPVLTGADPQRIGVAALHGLSQSLAKGAFWPEGGFRRLAEKMTAVFTQLGGSYRGNDPVARIHTIGNRAREVETASGWRAAFDALAHSGDVMHLYRDLLLGTGRGQQMVQHLAGRRMSPSLFVVHFAIEGSWPGIPHHCVLFGPRYRSWLKDVFDIGVLPRDGLISLHHPSLTDPTLAPAGKSVFSAVMPVAHLGKLALDWTQFGPLLEGRILDEIGRRLIPDIHDRIIAKGTVNPRDFALDFNCWRGSPFGPELGRIPNPRDPLGQRDRVFVNLYLAGGGQEGQGIGAALAQAKALAETIARNLKT